MPSVQRKRVSYNENAITCRQKKGRSSDFGIWYLVLLAVSLPFRVQSFQATTLVSRQRQQQQQQRKIICSQYYRIPSPSCFSSFYQRSSQSSLLSSSATVQQTVPNTISLEWADFYQPDDNSSSASKENIPVLLLHGLLGSKRNFASLASSLGHQLEKPRRILGVDLRNHGESDHSSQMTYEVMAADVLAFLDDQNLDQVILVGHSMGGKVAQALSLLHPHRVHGLVVLDIAPVTYTSQDPHWKAVEDILQAMQAANASDKSKSELDKALRGSIPDPNLRAFVLTNFDAHAKDWKIPISTICQNLDSLAGFDLSNSTTSEQIKYDGDVFIIHGGQSRFVRHSYMDQIAEFFPNHMLTTIRGAGHWVHAEAPDDTIALLKRYLDR